MLRDADIPPAPEERETLSGLVSRLEAARGFEAVRVGDLLRALEGRSLGVVVAGLGLFAGIPVIGAIPGVSVAVALLTLAVVIRSSLGRGAQRGLWLPRWLRRREIGADAFEEGLERARPVVARVDRHLRPRLTWLTRGPPAAAGLRLAAALLALAMIPLAAVPWGVTFPAAGLVALGLAMMTRDGLAATLGYALAAVTALILAALI